MQGPKSIGQSIPYDRSNQPFEHRWNLLRYVLIVACPLVSLQIRIALLLQIKNHLWPEILLKRNILQFDSILVTQQQDNEHVMPPLTKQRFCDTKGEISSNKLGTQLNKLCGQGVLGFVRLLNEEEFSLRSFREFSFVLREY